MIAKNNVILVMGAAGQLGRELMLPRPWVTDVCLVGVDQKTCDIADRTAVSRCVAEYQPALVINAAAYTAVDRAETETVRAFAVNAEGPANIAAVCAQAGIPLFHVSTDYVYDGSKATPWHIADATAPRSVYGASKLAGEAAVRAICRQHIILRTSWLFGRYGNNFVRTMVRLAATRDQLRVVADQRGCPTHVGDLAVALLELAQRHLSSHQVAEKELPWGIWHYCSMPVTTWADFARVIIDESCAIGLLSRRPPVQSIATHEYPLPAMRPLNSVLDMTETMQALGLHAADWRVGLRQVLAAWQREGLRFD